MIGKTITGVLIALLLVAACAAASGSGAVARQSVRLEVIPVVEVELGSPGSAAESPSSRDRGQTTTDEEEFGVAPFAVYPEGCGAKVSVTSEHGTSVEMSVEASAGNGDYPGAAVRLTLTDP
ncbi:MAG: hypothetical protein PVJ42_04025 [bacterium]|jgi:hypothetical protein